MAKPNGLREVSKLATCKKCGDSQLAWVKSSKGSWYLAEASKVSGANTFVAHIFQFHKCAEVK